VKDLIQQLREFSEERDWDQFHSPKNLAKKIEKNRGKYPANKVKGKSLKNSEY